MKQNNNVPSWQALKLLQVGSCYLESHRLVSRAIEGDVESTKLTLTLQDLKNSGLFFTKYVVVTGKMQSGIHEKDVVCTRPTKTLLATICAAVGLGVWYKWFSNK